MDIIELLTSSGLQILPHAVSQIRKILSSDITKEQIEKEVLPYVSFSDGSEVTVSGILNIFTNNGFELKDSRMNISGVTNIVSNDGPAKLNITSTKTPKKGQRIGSISFSSNGIDISSNDD